MPQKKDATHTIAFEDSANQDQFGASANGFLIYTAEGFVSAILGATERPDEAANFLAYCGPFTVSDEMQTVSLGIQISLIPDGSGICKDVRSVFRARNCTFLPTV